MRILRAPDRIEESIVPGLVAAMKKFSKSAKEEIWTIYALPKSKSYKLKAKSLTLISVWRYPGKSPARNPIPQAILEEIKSVLTSY